MLCSARQTLCGAIKQAPINLKELNHAEYVLWSQGGVIINQKPEDI